jgi:hypothetical protein
VAAKGTPLREVIEEYKRSLPHLWGILSIFQDDSFGNLISRRIFSANTIVMEACNDQDDNVRDIIAETPQLVILKERKPFSQHIPFRFEKDPAKWRL